MPTNKKIRVAVTTKHFVAPRKARAGHLPKDIRLAVGNDDEDAAGVTRFDSEGAAVTGLVWPETPGPPLGGGGSSATVGGGELDLDPRQQAEVRCEL